MIAFELRSSVACLCAVLAATAVAAPPSVAPALPQGSKPQKLMVYVGTYTGAESKGIYLLELDLQSGGLRSLGLAAETVNPSFLAIHPSRRYLYAVTEVAETGGRKGGAVGAFAIEPGTAKLKPLNQQSSRGAGPCHLVLDSQGKNVLVANYNGGSVAVLPIASDGQLEPATGFVQHEGSSVNPRRQEGPHAHSINLDKSDRFAVVADLGLDKVLVYRFDASSGTLVPNDPPAATVAGGSGPRHFAFHPGGRFAYVINELLSTVTAFEYEPQRGILKELHTISTLPDGYQGNNSTAEVQVHPSGKFLYGSNRGHHSIASFAIDAATGRLSAAGHQSTQGKTPRNFGIDPTGQYLLAANQDSDTIVVFRIDAESGKLAPTGHTIDVPKPVCVKFVTP
jgi:6-phosphogluconolactonase